MERVLVLAVHPDDETLGCGGTLLRHKADGDEIFWLIATQSDESHPYFQTRQNEIKKVALSYGFSGVYHLRFPTMRIDEISMSELIGGISKVINEVRPSVVYLPFLGDAHSDHRKIFEAAMSCVKSFRYPFVTRVLMMETLSETDFGVAVSNPSANFAPNVFVDVSAFMDKKCEIMEIYKSEVGELPFPRSIENIRALGLYRGCSMGAIESVDLTKSDAQAGGGGGQLPKNIQTAQIPECSSVQTAAQTTKDAIISPLQTSIANGESLNDSTSKNGKQSAKDSPKSKPLYAEAFMLIKMRI